MPSVLYPSLLSGLALDIVSSFGFLSLSNSSMFGQCQQICARLLTYPIPRLDRTSSARVPLLTGVS